MDFPLESIHKLAFKAAEVARCAGEQGKYWQMHAQLFANQKTLEPWTAHAEAVGLNGAQFETCLSTSKYAGEIRKDMVQAQNAAVTGTPAFFLALADPAGTKVKVVRAFKGAQPYAQFKAQLDSVLAQQGAEGKKDP